MRALALAIVLLVSTGPAEAGKDRRRIVGILDVRVEGVPKDIAAQFQATLEKKLDSNAYWLAPRARVHEMLANSTKWTEGCVVGACLLEVKTQTHAEVVLLASITGVDTSFGYVVTLVRTDTGQVLSQETSRCDVCTVKEALDKATTAAVRLVTAVPETLPDEAADASAALARIEASHVAAHRGTKRRHRNVALATTLLGIALAGAGVAVYVLGDHSNVGLATAAAGGGLTLGGVVALTF